MTDTIDPKSTAVMSKWAERAGKVTTPAQARALVRSALAEESKAGESQTIATVALAYATHAAEVHGLVGKGCELETWGAYGKAFNLSGTRITQYRRAGRAFAVAGVEPNTYLGRSLTRGAGAVKSIGEAIDSAEATPESVEAAWLQHYTPTGTLRPKEERPGYVAPESTPNAPASEQAAEANPMPRNNSGRLDLIDTALAALSKPSKAETARLLQIMETVALLAGVEVTVTGKVATAAA